MRTKFRKDHSDTTRSYSAREYTLQLRQAREWKRAR
jgi:hypothetical protein